MKKWLLVPALSLLLSVQSFAQTQFVSEPILLNYEQFSQLTHAEQKTYVKKLRETMVEVAQAYPEMAEEFSARSSFFAQLWAFNLADAFGEATYSAETVATFVRYANGQSAKYAATIEKAKTTSLTEADKAKLVEEYRQALYWSAAAAAQAHNITNKTVREKVMRESVAPSKKKVENLESKVKQFASEESYSNARDNYFKKAHQGDLLPGANFPKGALVESGDKLMDSKGAATATTVAAAKPKPETKPDTKPEAKPEVKAEAKPEAKKEEKKAEQQLPVVKSEPSTEKGKSSNEAYYRCMYAGFVIKNHPCSAPSKLPWSLKGLSDEDFACNNGTIMCNPFLFGFKSTCEWTKSADEKSKKECLEKAQPNCVKPGLYATKNCGEISNNDAALEASVHLIHNNIETFNQYGKSFDDLCNKHLINFNSYAGHSKNAARTKADITRTCDNARVRMDEIKKRYGIFKESLKTKSTTPTTPTKANEGKK